MTSKEFNNKISSLPLQKKILLLVLMTIVFVSGWTFIIIKPQQDQITLLEKQLAQETKTLQENLKICKDISFFEKEILQVQEELLMAQQQLPTKKEVPSLITKISDQGNHCGLEFELFQPQKETQQELYSQLPINIKVKGSYKNVTDFFQRISTLDRIVTIDDFTMRNPKMINDHVILQTTCRATTYRFQPTTSNKKKGDKGDHGKKK